MRNCRLWNVVLDANAVSAKRARRIQVCYRGLFLCVDEGTCGVYVCVYLPTMTYRHTQNHLFLSRIGDAKGTAKDNVLPRDRHSRREHLCRLPGHRSAVSNPPPPPPEPPPPLLITACSLLPIHKYTHSFTLPGTSMLRHPTRLAKSRQQIAHDA
jgi:hypothetical protein